MVNINFCINKINWNMLYLAENKKYELKYENIFDNLDYLIKNKFVNGDYNNLLKLYIFTNSCIEKYGYDYIKLFFHNVFLLYIEKVQNDINKKGGIGYI